MGHDFGAMWRRSSRWGLATAGSLNPQLLAASSQLLEKRALVTRITGQDGS